MAPMRLRRGFTLVELLLACTLAGLLMLMAWPQLRPQLLQAGRADAVHALTRLQQEQERFHAQHGLYAHELAQLGPAAAGLSPQGHYRIVLEHAGGDSWRASALAQPQGRQAGDRACARMELQVERGFARQGPDTACWTK